jgi:translocation and assembly module TamA
MTPPCRTFARWAGAAAVVAALAALGGCASTRAHLPGGASGPPPVLQLEVDAPKPLASLLKTNLDLGRVNRLAAGKPLPPSELTRLVAEAPEQARALLETEGYFNAQVEVQTEGGTPPRVRVRVQPGPRTTVADVQLQVQGPLAEATARNASDARDAQKALRSHWALPAGEPFRQQDWDNAKSDALTQLRAQGYVGAKWLATEARIDAASHRATLYATVDSGPLYRTGLLEITGLQHQDASTVRNIADFGPGRPATEALLLDFQDRLMKSDLFDRATVTLAPDAAHPEATPVKVHLAERKLQDAKFTVGIAADVGAHGSVEHVHRRPFGQPWVMRNKIDLAQLQQSWDGELSTQTLPGLWRNLVGAGAARTTTDTDEVVSSHLRAGRAQETGRISRLVFGELQHSITHNALGRQAASSIALHDHGIWRNVDNLLLPTRGRVWTGEVGAGLARSNPGGNGPFSRLYAKLNAYQPFGNQWHASERVELGQVFGRDSLLIPDELLFRAGGAGSVRGYAYRSLSPSVDGVQVSGRVLFTSSVELAHPILERLPDLWGAVFVDAGEAALHWNELHPALGYGIGARYRSPIGPVSVDLAYGQRVHHVRLHVSVGVQF